MCNRRPLLAALLLTAWALPAPGAAAGAGADGTGPVLEVISLNLRWGPDPEPNSWESRRGRVVALLLERAPAVVGLQESRAEYVDSLLPHLPGYAAYPSSGDRRNAVLYRADRLRLDRATSDAENARVDAPEADWGPGSVRLPRCVRLIDAASGAGFYVYNSHLDHRSAPSRQWSVRVLVDRVRTRRFSDPVVLTGDFNARSDEPALRFLLGEAPLRRGDEEVTNPSPFVDALRAVGADGLLSGTFHRFLGVRVGPRVDYVLVQPGIRVLSARVLNEPWGGGYPSDHFPVSATLALPPSEAR